MDSKWWFGKETNNNSRTTLKVPVGSFDKWSNSFVVGESVDNRFKKDGSMNTHIKFCKGKMKKLV